MKQIAKERHHFKAQILKRFGIKKTKKQAQREVVSLIQSGNSWYICPGRGQAQKHIIFYEGFLMCVVYNKATGQAATAYHISKEEQKHYERSNKKMRKVRKRVLQRGRKQVSKRVRRMGKAYRYGS